MKTPQVSVIIPNYNRAHYLQQTVESLLQQDYPNWEALVVDDGSSDSSKEVIEIISKRDNRIKWIERQGKLKGASVSRNIGVYHAKGNYLVFLDSDDLLAPHCLSKRTEVMEANSELDFAVFKMQFFYKTPGDDDHVWNLDNGNSPLNRFLNLDAVWQTTGPIWRKTAIEKIGGFNPYLQCWQDIDLHLKALLSDLHFKLFYELPADSYYRKNSEASISQQNTNSLKKLRSKAKICLWVLQNLHEKPTQAEQMILNILISATNGMQFHFFKSFFKRVHRRLENSKKEKIIKIAFIRFMRLDKFSYLYQYRLQLISEISKPNTIGKHQIK